MEPLTLPASPYRSKSLREAEAEDPRPAKAPRSENANTREMEFWFVTPSGKVVAKKEHAEVCVENDELWVRIDFSGRMPAGARAEQRGNVTLTWLLDALAPATVTPPPSLSVLAHPSIASSVGAKPAVATFMSLSPKSKSKEKAKRARSSDSRIVALLDNREVKDKKDRAHIAEQLLKKGIDCEVRALELGDVLWVVRRPNKPDLVLDWILERKRVSDLESSIMDKRYTEQKFRSVVNTVSAAI